MVVERGTADSLLVAIITWNSAAALPALIDSLDPGLEGIVDPDVLVVDNASSDDTREIAVAAGIPVLSTGANLGYAAAINAAYAYARRHQHVLILNPDIRLGPGSAATLLAALKEPGVGMAVPKMLGDDGRLQWSLRRFPSIGSAWREALFGGRRAAASDSSGEVIADPLAYEKAHDIEWATGAAVLVSADCRHALGDWDPTFFLYSEETEYMLRARARGVRIRYMPEAVVHHRGGELASSASLWQTQVRNRIGLYRRDHGFAGSLAFQAGVIVNEGLRMRSTVHRRGLAAALRPSRVPAGPATGMVLFAGVDWWYHNRAHSDVQLARQVADARPVLMVNSIGLRVPTPGRSPQPMRRIIRKAGSLVRFVRTPDRAQPNFHVMTALSLPSHHRALRRMSDVLVRRQVSAVATWYLLQRPHLLVTIPSADGVIRGMPRATLTFNRSDLHSALPEADGASVAEMEHSLLEASDLVLYVSHALMQRDVNVVGARGHFLDHGVDPIHFSPVSADAVPADLQAIPRPRLGFFGGLDDYVVDINLVEALAKAIPHASIVLVGAATCSMDRLVHLPNVHWLGMRPYEDIPAYGSGLDVALMPWLDNEWIRYCNPVKLKEYLCLGLPVVSTAYPEIDRYRDLVRVAADQDAFIDAALDALRDPGTSTERANRRARVMGDTWHAKAQELMQMLDAISGIPSPVVVRPALADGVH